MIELLIPMSGQGVRYQKAGYTDPKPLIKVNGTPMIERLLSNFPQHWNCTFVMAENHRDTKLPSFLKKLRPQSRLLYVTEHKEGPLKAIEAALPHLPSEAPVLVSYCDYGMIWDAGQFEKLVQETKCDACLISYKGFHAHYLSPTTYAYSRMDGEFVKEVREKGSFTSNRENEFASAGGYYFKSAKILKEAGDHQRKLNLNVNGEFYTSLTTEALLKLRPEADVRVFEIPAFFQWGTPQDLKSFEYWERTMAAASEQGMNNLEKVDQVLMPMAGAGSRFKSLTQTPKPFIKINGQMMFQRALSSLPKGPTTVVTIKEFQRFITDKSIHTVFLEKTPPGQALSTKEGISKLKPNQSVLISSCDHAIVLNSKKWREFVEFPDCDGAIFTVTGFPGTMTSPLSYSYVEIKNNDACPLVKSVSVKKPISPERPETDALLVGTFWFRSAEKLNQRIDELIEKKILTNNELYLDSIFNLMIEKGDKVRAIPLDGYINWGDPDSLAEALYWQEIWGNQLRSDRPRYPGVEWS